PLSAVYNNSVSVTGQSTLAIGAIAGATAVTFTGGLSMAAGSTLNFQADTASPANLVYSATFQGPTTISGAVAVNITDNGTASGTLSVGAIPNSAAGSITKTGGTLIVAGGSLGGAVTLSSGGLSVQGNLSVGSLFGPAGTTVNNNSANNVTLTVGSDNT